MLAVPPSLNGLVADRSARSSLRSRRITGANPSTPTASWLSDGGSEVIFPVATGSVFHRYDRLSVPCGARYSSSSLPCTFGCLEICYHAAAWLSSSPCQGAPGLCGTPDYEQEPSPQAVMAPVLLLRLTLVVLGNALPMQRRHPANGLGNLAGLAGDSRLGEGILNGVDRLQLGLE